VLKLEKYTKSIKDCTQQYINNETIHDNYDGFLPLQVFVLILGRLDCFEMLCSADSLDRQLGEAKHTCISMIAVDRHA